MYLTIGSVRASQNFVNPPLPTVTKDQEEINEISGFQFLQSIRQFQGTIIRTILNVFLITECTLHCQNHPDCLFSSLDSENCTLYSKENVVNTTDPNQDIIQRSDENKPCKSVSKALDLHCSILF